MLTTPACAAQEAERLRELAEQDRAAALEERDDALAARAAAEAARDEVRAAQGRYTGCMSVCVPHPCRWLRTGPSHPFAKP